MAYCTPNLSHEFDVMAKALANGISRRQAFKWVGAGVLGTMLAGLGLKEAEASACVGKTRPPGSCPPALCRQTPGDVCYCAWKSKDGQFLTHRRPVCVQDFLCAGRTICKETRECRERFGRNWKCVDAACCGGVACAAKCGTVAPCCTAQGGASATATGA